MYRKYLQTLEDLQSTTASELTPLQKKDKVYAEPQKIVSKIKPESAKTADAKIVSLNGSSTNDDSSSIVSSDIKPTTKVPKRVVSFDDIIERNETPEFRKRPIDHVSPNSAQLSHVSKETYRGRRAPIAIWGADGYQRTDEVIVAKPISDARRTPVDNLVFPNQEDELVPRSMFESEQKFVSMTKQEIIRVLPASPEKTHMEVVDFSDATDNVIESRATWVSGPKSYSRNPILPLNETDVWDEEKSIKQVGSRQVYMNYNNF